MFQQCARTNTRDVSAVPAPNDAIAKQALEARENDLRKGAAFTPWIFSLFGDELRPRVVPGFSPLFDTVHAYRALSGPFYPAALVRQSCSIASSQMINFDWSIKMVLASDTLASQRVPLFHLEMEVMSADAAAPSGGLGEGI